MADRAPDLGDVDHAMMADGCCTCGHPDCPGADAPAPTGACADCARGPCSIALMPGEACPCDTPGCACSGPEVA